MTQEAMQKIVDKCGRKEIYNRIYEAANSLSNFVFFRMISELYGVDEVVKSAQTMLIDSAAEINVLIDLLSNSCMTQAERYEMVCAEEHKCRQMVDELLGGDEL